MLRSTAKRAAHVFLPASFLILSLTLLISCGGNDSAASRSARAYDEAVKKGEPVTAGGHGGHAAQAADGSMAGMDPSSMSTSSGSMAGTDHSKMNMPSGSMSGMDHSKMNMPSGSMAGMDHSKMNMSSGSMAGMDHSKMNMPSGSTAGMDHSKMNMPSGSTAGMDHSKMNMSSGGNMSGMKMSGDSGNMAGMDHSKMTMSSGGNMSGMNMSAGSSMSGMARSAPLPLAVEAQPGQVAATLGRDPLDSPAPTAVEDAQRSADMAESMSAGDMMMAMDYRQYDAGRAEPTPTERGGRLDQGGAATEHDMPMNGPGSMPMPHGASGVGHTASSTPQRLQPAPATGRKSGAASRAAPRPKPTDKSGDVYYCPMHPEVTSDKPGNDPKCGMALVKKKEKK